MKERKGETMKVGVPKELKNNENRVAITPAGVVEFVASGNQVFIEEGAGTGSGIMDQDYQQAGAVITTQKNVWLADLVMKVKEPLKSEYHFFREELTIFTYLHLATDKALTEALLAKRTTSIAYESIELNDHSLPLLAPMSEIAGRLAVQKGASFLEKTSGGKGIIMSGVPGVEKGRVVIIGGGVAGSNAARMALGAGADVTILDVNVERLKVLEDLFDGRLKTVLSNRLNLQEKLREADLVIGAVLIPGHKAPKLISKEMVETMLEGSVIVDIAIDQGGIFETIDHVTTHDHPTYKKSGVIHYAVANMPAAAPRTATFSLTNVTTPYALILANETIQGAVQKNPAILKGINTIVGKLTQKAVAMDLNLPYTDIQTLIG